MLILSSEMVKKCIICNAPATYQIKDNSDYYCAECAEDNFADLSVLMRVEAEAQKLQAFVEERVGEEYKDVPDN